MRVAITVALLLAGCNKENPNYCPAGTDCTPSSCTASSAGCVCLNPPGVCVQCTTAEPAACKDNTPTCGPDHLCHACRANDDCASGACNVTCQPTSCSDAVRNGNDTSVSRVKSPRSMEDRACGHAMLRLRDGSAQDRCGTDSNVGDDGGRREHIAIFPAEEYLLRRGGGAGMRRLMASSREDESCGGSVRGFAFSVAR